jgi:hypothetical protein
MAVRELQRAALGPYRWQRMIEEHHANDTEGSPNRTELKPISTTQVPGAWSSEAWQGVTSLRWVPGGRFLFTAERNSLRLWDTGPIGGALRVGPHLLAEQVLAAPGSPDHAVNMRDLAVCVADEMKLRVALSTFEQELLV